MTKAIEQAKVGRVQILENMLAAISQPRGMVSNYAPKIEEVRIPVELIGEVIGPGGKTIKKIIADSGAQVEVSDKEDHGVANISGISQEAVSKAKSIIEGLIKQVQPGEIYTGTVKRIQPFGAFVEILPGKEGLVHVSDMAEEFVENPEDVVTLGQEVQVRVREIDNMGRINLSMRMDASTDKPRENRGGGDRDRGGRGGFGGGRGGRGGFNCGDRDERGGGRRFDRRDRNDRSDRPRGNSSGPHFPASRLMDDQGNKKRYGR